METSVERALTRLNDSSVESRALGAIEFIPLLCAWPDLGSQLADHSLH